MTTATEARRLRDAAAARYRPEIVELLLIAEAPPSSLDHYFYFEDVPDQDSLFRHVVRAVLAIEPSRAEKASELRRLADRGVFLIDLKPEPKEPGTRSSSTCPISSPAPRRWPRARSSRSRPTCAISRSQRYEPPAWRSSINAYRSREAVSSAGF